MVFQSFKASFPANLRALLLRCVIIFSALQGQACFYPAENADDGRVLQEETPQKPALYAARCYNQNPLRNAYFGDLHVHTALSIDAYRQEVRTLPRDAYAFARGEAVPFHDATVKIDRPLDFAAVTDHAEFLGELARCTDPDDAEFNAEACDIVRQGSGAAFKVLEDALARETTGSRAERITRTLEVLFKSEDPRWNEDICGVKGEL